VNAAAAEYPDGGRARFPAWPRLALLTELFAALSSRFGGDADPLDEDAVLELVERARAGDRTAGERLYRQLADRVFRTVRGMLHTDADAEDVTQDTLLTMLTSLDRYSPRADTRFAAWVTTIAVNTTRRRFRRLRPELTDTGLVPEIVDDGADLERGVDAARNRRALLNALAELPQRERDIVSLRYGAELNANEIANIIALEASNVRKILERTRVRLGAQVEAFLESKGEI
jgi:RNA polymerase sigma-70 factor (ECF subfamily)